MSHAPPMLLEVELLDGPLDLEAMEPFPEDAGAECVFIGRTRGETHPRHGRLEALVYHAYEPMARRMLEELAAEAVERFGCRAVRLRHATGPVAVGGASVVVQVASGHRGDAFEACRLLIDRLKHEVPIWKQERWADGTTWSAGSQVARR